MIAAVCRPNVSGVSGWVPPWEEDACLAYLDAFAWNHSAPAYVGMCRDVEAEQRAAFEAADREFDAGEFSGAYERPEVCASIEVFIGEGYAVRECASERSESYRDEVWRFRRCERRVYVDFVDEHERRANPPCTFMADEVLDEHGRIREFVCHATREGRETEHFLSSLQGFDFSEPTPGTLRITLVPDGENVPIVGTNGTWWRETHVVPHAAFRAKYHAARALGWTVERSAYVAAIAAHEAHRSALREEGGV